MKKCVLFVVPLVLLLVVASGWIFYGNTQNIQITDRKSSEVAEAITELSLSRQISQQCDVEQIQPVSHFSPYRIVYSALKEEGSERDEIGLFWPYNDKCQVSIVKTRTSRDGKNEVIVEDFVQLLKDKGLSYGKAGAPRPYVFSGDNLIFGGNNYEGNYGGFYVFDIETKDFISLTDSNLGDPGAILLSPQRKNLLIQNGKNELLIVNVEALTSQTIILDTVADDETLIQWYGMGRGALVGWVDDDIIWYAVFKETGTDSNTFARMEYVSL